MANNIKIRKISSSDIISESVDKLNHNFDVLYNADSVTQHIVDDFQTGIRNEISGLKDYINSRDKNIIDRIDDKISSIDGDFVTSENVQDIISNYVRNADDEMAQFIKDKAGEQISEQLGEYAKTSYVDDNYTASAAFEQFQTSAVDKIASVDIMAANSEFVKSGKYLVYIDSTQGDQGVSQYMTILDYYNDLNETKKEQIGSDFSDQEVMNRLITLCESVFKTTSTELAIIREEVGEGTSSVSIIAAVKGALNEDGQDAEDIAASIFAQANEEGSSIRLRANQIDLSSDSLNVTTGQFTVNENNNNANFQLKANGDVKVKGNITATSGSIGGITITSNTIKSSNNNFSVTNAGVLTAKTGSIGGITIASNGILTKDSSDNITAGMLGSNNTESDIRFFAGTESIDDIEDAPFRVYENGGFVAGQMSVDPSDGSVHFQSDKTYIDESGVLHAQGAQIDMTVSAKEFEATDNVEISFEDENGSENITYEGTITKRTTITGSTFNIMAEGEIVDTSDETNKINITGNSIYITIADKIENPEGSVISPESDYLCGVPVLCMNYNGKKYILSPLSWISENQQGDTSNMRWMYVNDRVNNDILKYNINTSAFNSQQNREYYIKDGDNYIFRDDKESTFISNLNDKDRLCKLMIYDPGTDTTATETLLNRYGLHTGTLSLKSRIDSIFIGYNENTKTSINDDTCHTFEGYKLTGDFGKYYNKETYGTNGSAIPSNSAIEKIYNWLKDKFIRDNNSTWTTTNNLGRDVTCTITNGLDSDDQNLPYESGTNYEHEHEGWEFNIEYYPLISFDEGSYNTDYADTVFVRCEANVYSNYDGSPSYYDRFSYVISEESTGEIRFDPSSIELKLKFDIILQNANIEIDPDSVSENSVYSYIENYIKTFNFDRNISDSNVVNCSAIINAEINGLRKTFTKTEYEQM